MKPYHRLSLEEREHISRMLANGHSLRAIAQSLGRAPSSVSRELTRNHLSVNHYRAVKAHKRAFGLAHMQRKHLVLEHNTALRCHVIELLTQRWSPEQIAKYLSKYYPGDPTMHISHETLYTYLYVLARGGLKKELIAYLRRRHSFRRTRKRRLKSSPVQDMTSIERRPPEVADRIVPGHWEGDLIMGSANRSALGTLVERKTRFTLLVPLKAKDARSVRLAYQREMKRLPDQLKRSLTYDQGQEMAEHKLFTKATRIKVFFAHPHSPWERGTNENTNGLLRQFFPKGTDFKKISTRYIKHVQKLFNQRPRKVLDWSSPTEIFNQLLNDCCASN